MNGTPRPIRERKRERDRARDTNQCILLDRLGSNLGFGSTYLTVAALGPICDTTNRP